MTTRYRAVVFLSVGLALLLLSVRPSLAYFERFFISTRTFSLGGAFVALADDPSAAVLNPAGLTQLSSAGFLASYVRPYDVSDLEEHHIAAAVPTSIGAFGVSWHRFGLRDVTSEDLITLAYGRDYIRTSQDASLSFGGSVDIARVDIRDTYNASKTVVSGSAGVLLQPFPIIGLGYSVRNIGQPSFDFVAGGGKTTLKTTQSVGLAYHWRRRFSLFLQTDKGQDGKWRNALGLEYVTGRELMLRAGLSDGDVAGGIGLKVSGLTVDLGMSSHDMLGVSYLVSVGFALPTATPEDEEW